MKECGIIAVFLLCVLSVLAKYDYQSLLQKQRNTIIKALTSPSRSQIAPVGANFYYVIRPQRPQHLAPGFRAPTPQVPSSLATSLRPPGQPSILSAKVPTPTLAHVTASGQQQSHRLIPLAAHNAFAVVGGPSLSYIPVSYGHLPVQNSFVPFAQPISAVNYVLVRHNSQIQSATTSKPTNAASEPKDTSQGKGYDANKGGKPKKENNKKNRASEPEAEEDINSSQDNEELSPSDVDEEVTSSDPKDNPGTAQKRLKDEFETANDDVRANQAEALPAKTHNGNGSSRNKNRASSNKPRSSNTRTKNKRPGSTITFSEGFDDIRSIQGDVEVNKQPRVKQRDQRNKGKNRNGRGKNSSERGNSRESSRGEGSGDRNSSRERTRSKLRGNQRKNNGRQGSNRGTARVKNSNNNLAVANGEPNLNLITTTTSRPLIYITSEFPQSGSNYPDVQQSNDIPNSRKIISNYYSIGNNNNNSPVLSNPLTILPPRGISAASQQNQNGNRGITIQPRVQPQPGNTYGRPPQPNAIANGIKYNTEWRVIPSVRFEVANNNNLVPSSDGSNSKSQPFLEQFQNPTTKYEFHQNSNPSSQYGSPQNSNPTSQFGSPQNSNPSSQPEFHQNSNPFSQHGSPQISNPSSQYGSPQNSNPSSQHGSPQISNPSSQYGSPQNSNPSSQFGSPQNSNPSSQFGSPQNSNPSSQHEFHQISNPSSQYGSPQNKPNTPPINAGNQNSHNPSSQYDRPVYRPNTQASSGRLETNPSNVQQTPSKLLVHNEAPQDIQNQFNLERFQVNQINGQKVEPNNPLNQYGPPHNLINNVDYQISPGNEHLDTYLPQYGPAHIIQNQNQNRPSQYEQKFNSQSTVPHRGPDKPSNAFGSPIGNQNYNHNGRSA